MSAKIIAAMDNFETLSAIAEEFKIKRSTLDIFGVAELVDSGSKFEVVTERPVDSKILPEFILDDDDDDSFCSLFSDILDNSFEFTQITQEADPRFELHKLHSDGEILSSEFEAEPVSTILTSEKDIVISKNYNERLYS